MSLNAIGDGKPRMMLANKKIQPFAGKNQPIVDREVHSQCIR